MVGTLFFSISLCFLSKRSVNIRFYSKFTHLWPGLSPSSRGVRSSDWMIIKAEALLSRMLVSPSSGFSSEKSYSGSKTHTKPKKAIHTPTNGGGTKADSRCGPKAPDLSPAQLASVIQSFRILSSRRLMISHAITTRRWGSDRFFGTATDEVKT